MVIGQHNAAIIGNPVDYKYVTSTNYDEEKIMGEQNHGKIYPVTALTPYQTR